MNKNLQLCCCKAAWSLLILLLLLGLISLCVLLQDVDHNTHKTYFWFLFASSASEKVCLMRTCVFLMLSCQSRVRGATVKNIYWQSREVVQTLPPRTRSSEVQWSVSLRILIMQQSDSGVCDLNHKPGSIRTSDRASQVCVSDSQHIWSTCSNQKCFQQHQV